jgi:thioredoxin-like negative regulator of GroEL
VPTMVMFKSGQEIGRLIGYNPEPTIQKFIEKFAY